MCNSIYFLIFLYIIKIIFFIVLPLLLIIFKNKIYYYKEIQLLNIFVVILFLIFYLLGNTCIYNLNINRLIKSRIQTKFKESYDVSKDIFGNDIVLSDTFKSYMKKNVYYYNMNDNNNYYKSFTCNNKKKYNRFYLENLYNTTTVLSYTLNKKINPNELINYSIEENLMDCESGISLDNIFSLINNKYNVNIKEISINEVENYIKNDYIIFTESQGNVELNSALTCDKGSFVIYNVTSNGDFILSSSNDKDYDYICPENSYGYGSVVKSNINNKTWDFYSLSMQGKRYFVMEKR